MEWTQERIDQAVFLWKDGLSASLIASRLGTTRNSVLGKIHRMGLSGRTTRTRKPHQPRKIHKRNRLKMLLLAPRITREEWVPQPEPIIPPHQRKRILDLEDGDCRWPCGDPKNDPDFGFCGRKQHDGLPYCLDHARIAYQPPKPRGPRAAQPAPTIECEKVAA